MHFYAHALCTTDGGGGGVANELAPGWRFPHKGRVVGAVAGHVPVLESCRQRLCYGCAALARPPCVTV